MVTYGSANGFTALSDPTRRAIFERLVGGPRSVGELAAGLPVSRPAVSQHLKVLKEAGLVSDRAEGARRLYRVEPRGVAAMRDYFDQLWNQALTAFKVAVENPGGPAPEGAAADNRRGPAPDNPGNAADQGPDPEELA